MKDSADRRFAPGFCPEEKIEITGADLTIEQVVAVARFNARVHLSNVAVRKVEHCRTMVDVLLDERAVVYGLTTGFGKLRDRLIPVENAAALQVNLIRSHSCGVGPPFAEDVVRAAMVLRINTLARGNSGIRLETLQQLINMINDRIYPQVPTKGSVGASGDLAPLSHMVLPLIGDSSAKIFNPDFRSNGRFIKDRYVVDPIAVEFIPLPSGEAFEALREKHGWKFRPVELEAKEGLALANGTQFMAAMAALAIYDGFFLLRTAEFAAAMSLESQRGVRFAYSEPIHTARNLPFQLECALRTCRYTEGSEILDLHLNSGYLNRAVKHLRDALDDLKEEFTFQALVPDEVQQVSKRISVHIEKIQTLLAEAKDRYALARGKYEAEVKRGMTAVRLQIKFFGELLKPVKTEVTETYSIMNAPSFPLIEEARSKMALAIADLERAVPASPPVQDDYSFRCFPQVVACAYRALWHVEQVVAEEINSATDNPLLFPPEPPGGWMSMSKQQYSQWLSDDPVRINTCLENVLCGGNFHGEPLAIAMDYLSMAMAEVANIAERRIAHLVDETVSSGLHGFLIESTGLNSGFMVPQYTAAALVSENKVLAHPACTDSIPTCAGSEDHVSMGTISARKCLELIGNVRYVLAIELFAAYQALGFRRPFLPGHAIRNILAYLKEQGIERLTDDRATGPDIERLAEMMRRNEMVGFLEL